ncbi:hypothetical protein GGR57DRAFT_157072 [Xylariaceae sp. FL1272]|nr:hypothetical protein GGR57DRAFT_157072 [Xylariaceae sp. FL1272]
MKSVSVAAAAVLAGVAVAQPHGNHLHQRLHAKRDIVTTWETVWETVTVIVDDETTSTVLPTTTPGAPGEFFQPSTTTSSAASTSTSSSEVVIAETPTTTEKAAPATPTTTSIPPPPSTTSSTSSTLSTSSTSSSVVVVEPTTTSVAPAPSTTTSEPAATNTASSGGSGDSGSGTQYSGDITYYTVGLGACGYDDTGKDDSMPIVAIAVGDWGAFGTLATNAGIDLPLNPWCGKELTITANGKTVKGQARDQCPGCASGSIDVSEKLFLELFGDLGVGRSSVSWSVSG